MTKTIIFVIIAIAIIGGAAFYSRNIKPEQLGIETETNQNTNNMDKVQTEDLILGTGDEAKNGDTLSVLYKGTLTDGTVFDESALHGNQPFEFKLGAGEVIKGYDEGLLGIKAGGKRKLTIPSSLGYGPNGVPGAIPPNSTLIFEVEVLKIK